MQTFRAVVLIHLLPSSEFLFVFLACPIFRCFLQFPFFACLFFFFLPPASKYIVSVLGLMMPWPPTSRPLVPSFSLLISLSLIFFFSASLLSSTTTTTATAAAKATFSAERVLEDGVARLAKGDAGAAFRSTTCLAIGPGGAGKTSARRAIQGHCASTVRVSTVGGERDTLAVVQLQHGSATAFATPSYLNLSNVERAMLQYLLAQKAGKHESNGMPKNLGPLVNGLDTFCGGKDLRRKHAEQEAALVAVAIGDKLDRAQTHNGAKGEQKTAVTTQKARLSTVAPQPTSQPGKTMAASNPDKAHPHAMSHGKEQIQANQAVVLQSFNDRNDADQQELVRVIFYDMGGQPEFWPLVGGFIRR